MKVNEFIKIVNSGKNKMMNTEQLQQLIMKTIETKKYLSIKEKRSLIDTIVNSCILYEDGIYKFDDIEKYICFTMKAIEAYTNLELSLDIEDDYDALCESRLLNAVIDTFNGEYENVSLLFQMKCDNILSNNNVEAQIGRFLTEIFDKLNIFTDNLTDKIDNFDLSNLQIDINEINKFMEFLNLQTK